MDLLTNGWNVLLILLGFGLLIFVHELGHFAAARWARLRCESFAIGMGPVVLAYRPGVGFALGSTEPRTVARFGRSAYEMTDEELAAHGIGETEYSLRILPLGGFVRLLGQEDLGGTSATARPRSYLTIPVWKRMVVVSAGVAANLVAAVALFVVAFMVGVRFEAPVVGGVEPGSPAALATRVGEPGTGLQPGDTIVSINGRDVLTFADIQIDGAMARPGASLLVEVERPGVEPRLLFELAPVFQERLGVQWIGITPASTTVLVTPRRGETEEWNAALRSARLAGTGLGAGAALEQVDGHAVATIAALDRAAAEGGGRPVPTVWRNPDGALVPVDIKPVPEFERLIAPAAQDAAARRAVRTVQPGLAGLLPLVRIGGVLDNSPNAGLIRPGDVVLRVATTAGPTLMEFREAVAQYKGNGIPLDVLREGRRISVLAQVRSDGMLGVEIGGAWDLPMVAGAQEWLGPEPGTDGTNRRSPAAELAIAPLSRVTAVGGARVENWLDMRAALQRAVAAGSADGSAPGGEIVVPIEWEPPQGSSAEETPVVPRKGVLRIAADEARVIAALGWASPVSPALFEPRMVTLQAHGNPLTAAAMGFRQTARMVTMTYLTIDRLIRGSVGVEQLRGPVGIVHLGARVADRGAMYLVFFLAAISVNLAVLNFLPLPIVDGGLFLYLLYERITGRPPSAAFQNAAIAVGLCLLGGIFLLTFYQDVMRLFHGT
jgi:regulator of sigma E protease